MHTTLLLPDWISYVNWPRQNLHLKISDSNLDWGQALPQVREWVDVNAGDRPVYLKYFGTPHRMTTRVERYVGDRVTLIPPRERPPEAEGLLIISPIWVTGAYKSQDVRQDVYASLREVEPIDTIGHSMLVYDMKQLEMPSPMVTTRDAQLKSH